MSESERDKMLRGELYSAADGALVTARLRARRLCNAFAATPADDPGRRRSILTELLGGVGDQVEIEPPFQCDYGWNISLGERVFINFGCIMLDCNRITIGDGALLGPGVHIYAATHPTDPAVRRRGLELALPVTIGDNAWIGGGVVICPGVEIGADAVVGAGSVVTRSVPAGMIAVGNPARVVRSLANSSRLD